MRTANILIIDDDLDVCDLLKDILDNFTITVTNAIPDAEFSLDSFDVVVIDSLPGSENLNQRAKEAGCKTISFSGRHIEDQLFDRIVMKMDCMNLVDTIKDLIALPIAG